MKTALAFLLVLTGLAHAATELAPASRVRTNTNNYHILTGNVAQVNFNEIDGWLTNHSGRISAATNLAQQAYDAATGSSLTNIAALQEAFTLRTYVYTHTNSLEITASAGLTQFSVPARAIGKIHPGMYVSNSAIFAAETAVTSVDWTNFVVNVDKNIIGSGTSTSCFAVATGTATYVAFTHYVPSGYSRCKVTVTGSGGTGGNDNDAGVNAGAGGGAGGTGIGYFLQNVMTNGASFSITAGKRPAVAASGASGNAGNSSSFGGAITATGGGAGPETDAASGGVGGTASGGTINMGGGNGTSWSSLTAVSIGGASYWGGGSGSSTGPSAIPYGAGGGGADDGTSDPGQAGNGIVVIEYY